MFKSIATTARACARPRFPAFLVALALLLPLAAPRAQEAAADAPPAAAADAGATDAPGAALPPLKPCPPAGVTATGLPLVPLPPAAAANIRDRVHRRVGGEVSSVCRTPFGLIEVVVDADVMYVDERVNYLVAGNAFDLRTKDNLTARRKEEAVRIDFKTLPLDLAVKTVRGNGSRVLAVFEDPNCPYCKRFEKDIASLSDTTIYTFLYPILSRDANAADDSYPKSRAIWCAPDRTAAWSQVMLEGRHLAAAPDSCKHPLEQILALGQKLHITGTPTLLFVDGKRAPGAIPLDAVQKMMSDAGAATQP